VPVRAPAEPLDVLDFDDITGVRTSGSAGIHRPWPQFTNADTPAPGPSSSRRLLLLGNAYTRD